MKEAFGLRPQVVGIPTTLESAQDLADRDPCQFEMWAATRIDGIKPNQKRGRDRGIDGRGYVWVGPDARGHPKYEKIIVSVKGGRRIGPAMVRDLKGTVEREKAAFGIFVCIREPTGEMRTEAAAARMYETPVGTKHPRLQIYTIGDYFAGRAPDLPKVSDVMQVPAFERTPGGRQTELLKTRRDLLFCRPLKISPATSRAGTRTVAPCGIVIFGQGFDGSSVAANGSARRESLKASRFNPKAKPMQRRILSANDRQKARIAEDGQEKAETEGGLERKAGIGGPARQ